MFEQITIEGKKYNLVPVEEQEYIFICEIDGKKYYLGPEAREKMTWEDAKEWAASRGGQLMSREVGILACKKAEIRKHLNTNAWYWLEDEYNSEHSWLHDVFGNTQYTSLKTAERYVRAVFVE